MLRPNVIYTRLSDDQSERLDSLVKSLERENRSQTVRYIIDKFYEAHFEDDIKSENENQLEPA